MATAFRQRLGLLVDGEAPACALLDTVRAGLAGQPPPGRPTLAKLTGATDYRVRVALAEL